MIGWLEIGAPMFGGARQFQIELRYLERNPGRSSYSSCWSSREQLGLLASD